MQETFVVKIMSTQDATWKGSIDWLCRSGEKKTQYFRSALELIRLIDSATEETKSESETWSEAEKGE